MSREEKENLIFFVKIVFFLIRIVYKQTNFFGPMRIELRIGWR